MAFDQYLADRIRAFLYEREIASIEKKMMGGLCFMIDDKMCFGLLYNKKHNTDVLMARIGEDMANQVLEKKEAFLMDFTGRPMKNFVFVSAEGFDRDSNLNYWLNLCLDFNPFAKASKKKKKS